MKEYVLDGTKTGSLEQFFDEIGRILVPGAYWGRNLDAFDDILRGGFGTPNEGFTIKWIQSAVAKVSLGYPETERQLMVRLGRCHPTNREMVARDLENARCGIGSTVFDWLVEIIESHGPNGEESDSNVHLVLE